MKYFKRHWNETRGDDFDNWGNSIWFFETDEHGLPIRQIEKYENGPTLKYGPENLFDEFGMLGDQTLDLEEFAEFEISEFEFNDAWN